MYIYVYIYIYTCIVFCLRRLRDERVPTRSPIALAQSQTIHKINKTQFKVQYGIQKRKHNSKVYMVYMNMDLFIYVYIPINIGIESMNRSICLYEHMTYSWTLDEKAGALDEYVGAPMKRPCPIQTRPYWTSIVKQVMPPNIDCLFNHSLSRAILSKTSGSSKLILRS